MKPATAAMIPRASGHEINNRAVSAAIPSYSRFIDASVSSPGPNAFFLFRYSPFAIRYSLFMIPTLPTGADRSKPAVPKTYGVSHISILRERYNIARIG